MAKRASKSSPAAELGNGILAVLEKRAAAGGGYPCSAKAAATESSENLSDEQVFEALHCAPLKTKAIVAFADDVDSLIALKADKERLAGDDRILRQLLMQMCSPQVPHVPLDALKVLLNKPVQGPFAKEWKQRIATEDLPDFANVVLVKPGNGKAKPELHDVRFPLPWVEYSAGLLNAAQSRSSESSRTFTLSELADAAGDCTDELLKHAVASEPFASSVVVVRKFAGTEWFALSDDAGAAVVADDFLRAMLQDACTADNPEAKLSALKKQLPKDLQSAFKDHWLAVAGRGESKSFYEIARATKADLTLRDTRFPRPEVVLSDKLVAGLTEMKNREDRPYPCTFSELCNHLGPTAGLLIASAATQLDPYRSQVVAAFSGAVDSPIALKEDTEQLASSPTLLSVLLSKNLKTDHQAIAVDKLSKTKGLHGDVQPDFQPSVEQMIHNQTLPPGVGALQISKKWNLFRLESVVGMPDAPLSAGSAKAIAERESVATPPARSATNSFASDFTAAYERLDRESGSRNYIKLLELRRTLSQYPAADFDRGILDLCRNRKFGLEGSEGSTVKLTEEERSAGIMDAGSMLVYCRRRN